MIRSEDIVNRDNIQNRGNGLLPRQESATGMFPSMLGEFELSEAEPSRSILSMAQQSGLAKHGVSVQSLDDLERDRMSNSELSLFVGAHKSRSSLASSSTRQQDRDFQNEQRLNLLKRQPLTRGRPF